MSKEGEPDSWGILDHERMIKGNLSQSGLKFRLLLDDRMTLRTFPCSFRSYKVTSSYDICRTFDNVLKQAIIYFILWEKLQRTIHHQLHKAVLCKEKGKLIARENAPKNPYESFVKVIQIYKTEKLQKGCMHYKHSKKHLWSTLWRHQILPDFFYIGTCMNLDSIRFSFIYNEQTIIS